MKVDHPHISQLIEQSGLALYGERWKTALSADLGITFRTLQNWLDGQYAAKPDIVLPQLKLLLTQRHKKLDDVIAAIRAGMAINRDGKK